MPWRLGQDPVLEILEKAWDSTFDSSGRNGVRIFRASRLHLLIASVSGILVGLPFAFMISLLVPWELIGEFDAIKKVYEVVAPGIWRLSDEYRPRSMPNLPLKRFLVGCSSLLGLLVILKFAILFTRQMRRNALLVCLSYGRLRILRFLAASGAIFVATWCMLFADLKYITYVYKYAAIGFLSIILTIMSIALFAAILFGRTLAIAAVALMRCLEVKMR
jgi:hypothetical protein